MWRPYAKNVLLLIFTASILSIGPAVTYIAHNMIWTGLIILLIAVFFNIASQSIGYYWHKRGIHATPAGFIAALLFFIAGTIWSWRQDFYFWIPVILAAAPIIYGYAAGKNKR